VASSATASIFERDHAGQEPRGLDAQAEPRVGAAHDILRQREEIGAEPPEHRVAQQQRQPEGAENLRQHRPLHDGADQAEIDHDAERREHNRRQRRADQRAGAEQREHHERDIHPEHDEIAMGEIDDVHHAPDQRQA
jgi:hypothetical protein